MGNKFKIFTAVLVVVCVICMTFSLYFKFYKKDKVLVLYFSHDDYVEKAAKEIQKELDADIFEIETVTSYSDDYETWQKQAYKEYTGETETYLAEDFPNLKNYDVIYIGYPIWFNDMPKVLYKVFEQYDFSGKTIKPFYESNDGKGSWTVGEILSLESKANINDSFVINDDNYKNLKKAMNNWIS